MPAGAPAALYDRIRTSLAQESVSRTRTPTRTLAALAVVAVLATAVVVFASELVYQRLAAGLEVDPANRSRLLWTLLLLAGLTVVSTAFALWRGRRGFGVGAAGLAIAAVLVAPVYAALTLVQPLHLQDTAIAGVTISPWGVRCALIAGIIGIAAVLCFAAALRRAVPVASRLRGTMIGATAGAWAGLAVFVFCPSGEHQHVLAGHVLPVIALTAIGALVAPRLLRP
jgi:hypothetical protein